MKFQKLVGALLATLSLLVLTRITYAEDAPVDLTPRLREIFELRAQWLKSDESPQAIEGDYLPDSSTARWALEHEQGKIRYVREWAKNRGVRIVQSKPEIKVRLLKQTPDRARFYVVESLALGYVYPNEKQVNMFGVGSRHIVELRRRGEEWFIGLEWYSDPLGDDSETPAVLPALIDAPLPPGAPTLRPAVPGPVAARGYNREGAVRYANEYCGVAWGCGNTNRYNTHYRDYSGEGGDCTNFVSQVLREGGGLRVPTIIRVDAMAGHLQHTGKGILKARGTFPKVWKQAVSGPEGFRRWLDQGDLVAYQEKGKFEHFAIVTGFDTRGYPLVNSHTADRYHVPFDLGWDRKTVYWLFHVRE